MDENNEGAEVARRLAKQWLAEGAELISVRHLSLDLTEPISGWELALLERGVEIVDDDLGRQQAAARAEAESRKAARDG